MNPIDALERIMKQGHRGAIACDPGGTTGLAWSYRNSTHIYTEQVPQEDTIPWIREFLKVSGDSINVLVVEQHIPKPGMTMGRDARLTMELVGKLEIEAVHAGCEVVRHNPSQMKTVPWMREGRGVHARDASKHLARFILDDAADHGLIQLR